MEKGNENELGDWKRGREGGLGMRKWIRRRRENRKGKGRRRKKTLS